MFYFPIQHPIKDYGFYFLVISVYSLFIRNSSLPINLFFAFWVFFLSSHYIANFEESTSDVLPNASQFGVVQFLLRHQAQV